MSVVSFVKGGFRNIQFTVKDRLKDGRETSKETTCTRLVEVFDCLQQQNLFLLTMVAIVIVVREKQSQQTPRRVVLFH